MAVLRILIADDHAPARMGLRLLLACEPDFELIGEAENGRAAIELVPRLQPDLVLMDVRMPVMDGVAATAELRRLYPGVSVMLLSIHDDAATRARVREAGAAAFFPKHEIVDGLVPALHAFSIALHADRANA